MMRGGTYDPLVIEAIYRIRQTGRWKVIALTNNFGNPLDSLQANDAELAKRERDFFEWKHDGGPANGTLRAMFDDFIDSSAVGKRCVN